jgi:succinate dehydrogenase / fumarate reductase cytochrome b subunit
MTRPSVQALSSTIPGVEMQRATTFLGSSIGLKVVMAATGLVFYGFVLGHMAGNLQIYLGREAINSYAVFLREFLHGGGIWIARATLLACVVVHVWTAVVLTLRNWAARPVGYRDWRAREANLASRTMIWTGPLLGAFVLYHLAHLTWGNANPDFVPLDAYHNLVVGLSNPFAAAFYVLAMLALGLHLYHGFWSMLQTFGLELAHRDLVRHRLSLAFALVVVLGNISIPIAVLSGLVHL